MRARSQKVLIVDDEYVPRSLESIALEGTGRYETVETANALDALHELSVDGCTCVVVDMVMPDMTGMELVKLVRRDPRHRDIPIVLVLPEDCASEDLGARYPGVNDVIAKPFDPWDLVRRLDLLLGRSGETDANLTVESVLKGFPYPTMVIDSAHRVIIANTPFYDATDTGVDSCYLYCNRHLHEDGNIPERCPLEECVTTGKAAERRISTVMGDLRVMVYPLPSKFHDGRQLFLHVTEPIRP